MGINQGGVFKDIKHEFSGVDITRCNHTRKLEIQEQQRKKKGRRGYVIRGNYHEAGRNGKYYIQRINQKYEDIKGLCQTEKSEPCKIPNHATVKRLRYDNKQVKMDETSEKSVTILP